MRLLERALAVTVALTTAVTLVVPTATAESVPPTLGAQVVSPVGEGRVLSGMQPVVVRVTAAGGVTPSVAAVTVSSLNEPTIARTGSLRVAPGCAPTCDVTVVVDTLSWMDRGPEPSPGDTMLPDGPATMTVVLEGTTTSGSLVRTTVPAGAIDVDNHRPQLWVGSDDQYLHEPVVGTDPIAVDAVLTPVADGAGGLQATVTGAGVSRTTRFAATPLDGNHQSRVVGSIPTTGLPTGRYTLRFIAFDDVGTPSVAVTRELVRYSGPQVRAGRLVAQQPTDANGWKGGIAEVTLSVGPGWSPFQPKRVEVFLDGATTPAGTMTYFPRVDYCTVNPAGSEVCPSTIKVNVPLSTPAVNDGIYDYGAPMSTGVHRVVARYTEATGFQDWRGDSRTATAETISTLAAAGVTATTSVNGPVVQNASGSLAFTLSATSGTGVAAPQVRSWKAAVVGGRTLASGACAGASCLTIKGSVSLKSLVGGYRGIVPDFHLVPVVLTSNDSVGVVRTTTLEIPVDPAVRTAVLAPTSGVAGSTASLTVTVQQLDNEMLPGIPVVLQTRTVGSSVWRTVTSTRTTSSGIVRVPVALKDNAVWRSVVPARPSWNGGATSAEVSTKVAARVTVLGVPARGSAGRLYPVKATVYPVSAGRRMAVQVRAVKASGSAVPWRTVARLMTNRSGQISTALKFTRGTWQVRVVAEATSISSPGASTTLTSKVS